MPVRIQRSRKKGYKQPENTKYVGRGTYWGNPFKIGEAYKNRAWIACMFEPCDWYELKIRVQGGIISDTIDGCLWFYRIHLKTLQRMYPDDFKNKLDALRKYDYLSCFCPLTERCHVDVILEILSENN